MNLLPRNSIKNRLIYEISPPKEERERETMTIFKNQFKDFDDQINNNRSLLFYENDGQYIFLIFLKDLRRRILVVVGSKILLR